LIIIAGCVGAFASSLLGGCVDALLSAVQSCCVLSWLL